MLCGGLCIIAINVYGIVIASLFRPTSYVIIITSILTIALVAYIEFNKKRILLQTKERQSFIMFALIIVCQLYYIITALSLLVYMSDVARLKIETDSSLKSLVVGIGVLPPYDVEKYNLPYYFGNFVLFMYYLRCFYVMFWRENIVFIYRYLKTQVNYLNQTLLAHLPKIKVTEELKETICSLCLEEYTDNESVTRLHCQHVYHLDCIKVWVLRSNCCPLCRKKVVY